MAEEFIYPTKQTLELHEQINMLLLKQDLNGATEIIDRVISGKINISNTIPEFAAIDFASRYIDIADDMTLYSNLIPKSEELINKAFGIFNQNKKNLITNFESLIRCNRARAYMIKFDNQYRQRKLNSNEEIKEIAEVDSIFDIENTINKAIKNYWSALKFETNDNEKYNIRNNLSNSLLRTGRYIEAKTLFEQNTILLPTRWESNGGIADTLYLLVRDSYLPETASLYCVQAEYYSKILKEELNPKEKARIENFLQNCANKLEEFEMILNEDLLKENRKGEAEEFDKLSEYRKFVLNNNLSINEHALYCKCLNAAKDNLKIGTFFGSVHLSKPDILPLLDGLVNRIISEFAYTRLLYFNYAKDKNVHYPDDLDFSPLSVNDILGYNIELLRASFRLAYSILDKIANGILILFEINKDRRVSYFEDVFDIYRDKLDAIKNIHLTALYSMSLDLNRGNGNFKHFKVIRNEMEHGYLAINDEKSIAGVESITKDELKQLTLDVLQLTRAAIFSFVFLIRSKTIYKADL